MPFKNNGKIKLMIIGGTRPEFIRLSEVIRKCRDYFDTLLVDTGQNYDYSLNGIFFKDLEIAPPDLSLKVATGDLGTTMGNILAESYRAMVEEKPEALLVLGDTNSCLSAISAKRLHIPVFHMEAGNRCKDECLPEETNRRIVDIIADVNLPYTERARAYLAECGFPKERTYVTGSPMAEVLSRNINGIESSDVLDRLSLQPGRYFLLSAHREENIDNDANFFSLFNAVNALAKTYDMPVLYSCHPRSKKRLKETGFVLDSRVKAQEPFGFLDYNKLQMNAYCILSDSGTLAEESSFYASIGKPVAAVSLRTSTERPEGLEASDFILSGIDEKGLLQAVEVAVKGKGSCKPVPDYTDTNVSDKVVKIIQSYVGIVNKMVWRKQ